MNFWEDGHFSAVVAGLGLIGGSFAYALRRRAGVPVTGINRSISTQIKALHAGAIDKAGSEEDLAGADLVVLGLYPEETLAFVRRNVTRFRKGAVVLDTCGVKTEICRALTPLAEEYEFVFLGGHPMAGKEVSGFDAAEETLFDGASMILTPQTEEQQRAARRLEPLFLQLGFGRVTVTDPAHHDRVIAFTSQIPHVLANAYVKSPASREFSGFSAGSFRDVSRVARLHAGMWTQLFLLNRAALVEQIDILQGNLQTLRDAIDRGDAAELERLLREGSEIKEQLDRERG